jgi:hypothetical protein
LLAGDPGDPGKPPNSIGRAVFQALRKRFHYVILDCPPIGSIADYEVIQAVADGAAACCAPTIPIAILRCTCAKVFLARNRALSSVVPGFLFLSIFLLQSVL